MIKATNFVIKLRAYPNSEQRKKIDEILNGVRVAYNVTAYEISQGNPSVTKPDKKDPSVLWPDFSACMKKEWLAYLRDNYEAIQCVPAASLSSSVYGIFVDMKKSWENDHPLVQAKDKSGNPKFRDEKPVYERLKKAVKLPATKWKPDYYSRKKPRTSFTVQTCMSGIFIPDDSKAVRINITNVGKIKCRGWRDDLRFGEEEPLLTFQEAFDKKKAFGVTVSKDNCGDYYVVIKLQTTWIPDNASESKIPLGVDAGIKDVAITSDGDKYPNAHFKKQQRRHKKRLNRKLSRRQGWANEVFREQHKKDKELVPSVGYDKVKAKIAKLDRKIARKRELYNGMISASIVNKASFIGIESLNVKGMMTNHHLADALSDVAMYDILSKIKYKAEWQNIPVVEIGQWEPSSQLCSICGFRNPKVKNLNVREWTCPECGTHHDRDINAAKNILDMAKANIS